MTTDSLLNDNLCSDSPIFIGIAGWSYPDWDGYVYDRSIKDKLAYVAGFVDMIEINNTFYRPPEAKNVESWVKRTAYKPGFFFTAKLHQDVTHGGKIESATVKAFHEGLKPMTDAGVLRHLLAQFSFRFTDTAESRAHLTSIKNSFGDISNVAVELRHNSWQSPEALDYLSSLNVTVANLDYPESRDAFTLRYCTVGKHAYFRLHGRNSKAWFDKKAGRDETYNYRYSSQELTEIAGRTKEISKKSDTVTVVANNHYRGQQMVNALQLKAMITGRKPAVPERLLERYPDIESSIPGSDL